MSNHSIKRKWIDVKHLIKELNPEIYFLLERIGVDEEVVYEASYQYGFVVSDEKYFYMHDECGELQKREFEHYPYMILLEKNLELILETESRIIPNKVYHPGDFMPMTLDLKFNDLTAKPASPFKLISGARSVTFMPMSRASQQYSALSNAYNIKKIDPSDVSKHFDILASIANAKKEKWAAKILVFNGDIKRRILSEDSWLNIKQYLYEQSIRIYSFQSNICYLDYAIAEIMAANEINIRPFTVELIKQVLLVAIGVSIGYKPMVDEEQLPLATLTNTLSEFYSDLNTPIFIGPSDTMASDYPTYLPVSYFEHSLSDPKKFRLSFYLQELINVMPVFLKEFKRHSLTRETVYSELGKRLSLKYYSERGAAEYFIKSIKEITRDDKRFNELKKNYPDCKLGISSKSSFSKALVSVKLKRKI